MSISGLDSNTATNWFIGSYKPNSLFSLRMSHSTSSGGKTLFSPTPYSFKMAAIDAAFRAGGRDLAVWVFNKIKARKILFKPPEHLIVNNTFIKIKREPKNKSPEQPYISSIAFREFCFFRGELQVALNIEDLGQEEITKLDYVFAHIYYLGKRGSFFQFIGSDLIEKLPRGFSLQEEAIGDKFDLRYQVVQFLDDFGEVNSKDLFERIDSYSGKSVERGKHRVLKPYFLPYKMVSSSQGYTYYHNELAVNAKSRLDKE